MSRQDSMKPTAAAARRALPWLIVFASLVVGYQAVMPPSPLPESAAADEFSAARAVPHVEAIAARPHPMGSAAIEDVRMYITEELERLGLAVETQSVMRPSYFEDRIVPVVNLVARIPGTDSSGTITLIGHYDTVPETPGANDNTSAVAALLETGRALLAGPPPRNDILLLFTDSEEPAPRHGAVAFISENPAFEDISLIVNLEATGGHGSSLAVEASGPQKWLVEQLGQIGSRPSAFSFLTETSKLIGDIGTDFDEFRNAGIAGFHFAFIQGADIYHTPDDNIAALSHGSMQHHGDHALGIARHFGDLDLSIDRPDRGAVFFSLPPFLVVYSTSWTVPLMMLAAAGMVSGVAHRRNATDAFPVHRAGSGFLISLAGLVAATLCWVIVTSVRPSLGLFQAYATFAILTSAAAFWVAWANQRFRPEAIGGYGPLLPLLALSIVTAFVGVGFSYLFTLPALAAASALWLGDNAIGRYVRLAIVAVVTIVLCVPAIDTFLQFASPRPGNPGSNMAAAALVPFGLALLVIGLLRSFWPAANEG